MQGKLVQVNHLLVTTGNEVTSLSFTNINTTDVYVLYLNNVTVGGAGGVCDMSLTKSGTKDTTNDVNIAWVDINYSQGTYQRFGNTANQSLFRFTDGMGTGNSGGTLNAICYLYNWTKTDDYKFITMEVSSTTSANVLRGYQQGGVKKTLDACDGIYIETNQTAGGGFQDGSEFTLYKLLVA